MTDNNPDTVFVDRQLSQAIFHRKPALLAQLLDAGADVNAAGDEYGRPLLIQAIVQGRDACALMLIKRGACLTAANKSASPLTMAVRFRNKNVCRALIAAGVEVNGCDSSGKTPLYEAVLQREPEICRLLLGAGADVHEESGPGWLPLNASAGPDQKAEEIVRTLVRAGACPSKVQSHPSVGQKAALSAFKSAVENGHQHHVRYFIDECGEDARQSTADGRSMLELTANDEVNALLRAAIVEKLVRRAVDPAETSEPDAAGPSEQSPSRLGSPSFGAL